MCKLNYILVLITADDDQVVGANRKPVGTTLATRRRPPRMVFPMSCKGDLKTPRAGSLALQVERGVLTTRLQSVNSEERRNCRGSNSIENTPAPLVVVLETAFPPPHCSCTRASIYIIACKHYKKKNIVKNSIKRPIEK
jgi:hypothetical protein